MKSESVHDIAVLILTKAGLIVNTTVEADITEALNHIEAAVKRARAIL